MRFQEDKYRLKKIPYRYIITVSIESTGRE